MPEYLAILIVTAGLVVLVAVLLIISFNKMNQRMTAQISQLDDKLAKLAERLESIETAYTEHGRDLEAIRSEYALHAATQESSDIDYEQAIKAAARGVPYQEVSQTYGLREAEARLLVSVYGNHG